jgi:glycosyltransferase involved in cell wall biosynthesis
VNQAPDKPIILFTSNYQGGILQFTVYLAEVIARQGRRVHLFIPDTAGDGIPASSSVTVHRYRRFKKLLPKNKDAAELSLQLDACRPERVLLCDDTILTAQVMRLLDPSIRTVQFVHDVSPHPAWAGLYEKVRMTLERTYRSSALNKAGQIVMLSKNGYEQFAASYPKHKDKADYMLLGAHVPEAQPVRPPELDGDTAGYYLFFGRIDKYKGILSLLKAYVTLDPAERPGLIIAGSGALQEDEAALIAESTRHHAPQPFYGQRGNDLAHRERADGSAAVYRSVPERRFAAGLPFRRAGRYVECPGAGRICGRRRERLYL